MKFALATSASLAMILLVPSALAQTSPRPPGESPGAAQPAPPSPAVPADADTKPPEERSPFSSIIRPYADYAFAADLKDSEGRVSTLHAGLDIGMTYAPTQKLALTLRVQPEYSYYNFSDASGIIPGTEDPFNDLYTLDILPGARYVLNQEWALVGGALFEFAGESDADIGDSATFGGFVGARYAFSDRLAVTFGALGKNRLEEDALLLPLIGIDWQITDSLLLTTSGMRGTGLSIINKIDEQWSVRLTGGWELREFRLADDGLLPNGVVRDRRVPVRLGVDWKPTPRVGVTFEVGAVVWQRFNIDDSNSDRVSEDNTRPAPFIGASVEITF